MISVLVVVGGGDESKLQAEGGAGLAALTGAWSLLQEFSAVFAGRSVIDRAVRADFIVFFLEGLGDTLSLEEVTEEFPVEAFIAGGQLDLATDGRRIDP